MEDDATIIDTLVPAVRRQNRERRRDVLVMMENLDDLCERQIKNPDDIAALRAFFADDNGCRWLATAPLHVGAITRVGEPFYGYFDVRILEDLSESETLDLIRRHLEWEGRTDRLAGFEALRPKLLALYRMTGGNPRRWMMLYELIARRGIAEARCLLQMLVDRVTPVYQSLLNDLSPQERAVLETVALMRDQDKTPAAIAARMRIGPPQTSSLLKRLTDARHLRSTPHPQDRRSRLYVLRDGFFDVWLAMDRSRGARERLVRALDFLERYYAGDAGGDGGERARWAARIDRWERQRAGDFESAAAGETP